MDGKTFEAQIGKWAASVPHKMDAFARQVVQELASRVVQRTPVDTGFLRGSWQPSIGEPSLTHKGSEDKAGAKVSAAISVIIPQIKAGVKFYLMNNANYARPVEYGTAKMAGRHYVTDTAKAWPSIARDVAVDMGMKA